MNLFVTLFNLVALMLGIVTIGLAIQIVKDYKYSFTHYYLYFIICSVVSGFFDWISYSWIYFLNPRIAFHYIDLIYHIFWDLLGFPSALLAAYFLLSSILQLVNIELNKKIRATLLLIVFALTIFSLIGLILRFNEGFNFPTYFNWMIFLYALPVINFGVLLFGLKNTFTLTQSVQHYSKRFILILVAGYSAWYFLMYLHVNLGEGKFITIVVFYLALFFPTFYLYRQFKRQKHSIHLQDSFADNVKIFLSQGDFTEREKDIIKQVINGLSNQQIADELFISLQTVKNYISRIYKKLNVKSRIDLLNLIRNFSRNKL